MSISAVTRSLAIFIFRITGQNHLHRRYTCIDSGQDKKKIIKREGKGKEARKPGRAVDDLDHLLASVL